MKQIIPLLLFTLTLFANIPPQITYNDQHQPLVVEYEDGSVITYTYDEAGNITRIETPTQSISKTYDALNRLKSVTDAQGTTTYEYDAIGRVTKVTYPSGITTEYGYDLRDRITRIVHKASDGTILRSFAYSYDAVGNPVKVVENTGRTVTYEYNSVNQLIKETVSNDPDGNNTVTTFAYDQAGNLVSKTVEGITTEYSYDADGKLIQKGSITYTYDANGNLIDDGTNAYEYDDKNRLVKVTTPTQTIEYSYDAQDHRIAKIVEGTTTTYLVDPNTPYARVIHESRDNGTEIDYSYGLRLLSDGSHNFLTDALGSTRGLADRAGQLTDSYDYTPYGELLRHSGTSDTPFLFTGEQYDPEAGLYYLRARYYSPELARFLSRDTYDGTLNDPLSQNHYLYAGGNPVMYVDPSGHMSMLEINMVNNIIGSIGRISMGIGRIGSIISDAEILVTSYNSIYALTRASQLFANFDGNLMEDSEFKKAMENYAEGMATLVANAGRIVMRLSRGKARKRILDIFIRNRKSSFVIYGPTPQKGLWLPNKTKINLGKINVGRSSRKIILELGRKNGQGGRFIGAGSTQGGGKNTNQWFRMDWHSLVGHSEASRDWESGNYHFHIGKALK